MSCNFKFIDKTMEISLCNFNRLYEKGNVFTHLAKEYDRDLFFRYSIHSHSIILLNYILKYNQIPLDRISLDMINEGKFIQDIEALGGFPDASDLIMRYFKETKNLIMLPDDDLEYFKIRSEKLQSDGMIWVSYIPMTQYKELGSTSFNIHFFKLMS